jgi:hypothetical protein
LDMLDFDKVDEFIQIWYTTAKKNLNFNENV